MPGVLRLVVDSKLFHECQRLDDPYFPWSAIGDFDEIDLIVPAPIVAELDNQKDDPAARVRKRARIANGWFRELLKQSSPMKTLRESAPRVTLRPDETIPMKGHENLLDYGNLEDQIVGIAAALAAATPNSDIRLLSDDTGHLRKAAQAVHLPLMTTPSHWLRTFSSFSH